jgi:riboflavin transporter FmnP
MIVKKRLQNYIKSPMTEQEKSTLISQQEKEMKKQRIYSIVLLCLLPFLKTIIDLFSIFINEVGRNIRFDGMSATEILVTNIIAFIIGYIVIKSSSKLGKIKGFIISYVVLLGCAYAYVITHSDENNVASMFIATSLVSILMSGLLLMIFNSYLTDRLNDKYTAIYDNKSYLINSNSLIETNDINENTLINNESKMFYKNIKKLNRKLYKFEYDIIVDMNLKEYEIELNNLVVQ